jgi:hypothetical protein
VHVAQLAERYDLGKLQAGDVPSWLRPLFLDLIRTLRKSLVGEDSSASECRVMQTSSLDMPRERNLRYEYSITEAQISSFCADSGTE